jgi:branched-chain amino acid transport system ATP-binding protein
MRPSDAGLLIEDLTVARGAGPVLNSLSLAVGEGETVALLGRNGAGKTTLLETIAGLLRPLKGSIRLDGVETTGMRPHAIARRGLSLVPDGRQLFPNMTVLENLALGAHNDKWWLHGPARDRYDDVWELFPQLPRLRDQKAGALSGGQQQMVTVARALMARPKVLLLDEPTFGLSPQLTDAMCEQLGRLHERGMAILVAEQNVDVATDLAERVVVLAEGAIVASDRAEALYDQPVFREAMFGTA